MPLHFITGNKNKLVEIREILGEEVMQLDIELPEIQSIDPHEIIRAKLQEALKHHTGPLIVEDTSLAIDELNGLPGPFIKWFLHSLGIVGIWGLAKNLASTKARAIAVIGYASSPERIEFFEGVTEGQIVSPRGETKFGWDPIFEPAGHNQTFAEMTSEQKNSISHRRQAVNKLKKFLS